MDGRSIIFRRGQDQFAAVKEIATFVADFSQQPRINFQPGFEFVITQANRIPDGKRAFAIEFKIEINQPVLTVLVGKAPHFIQLYEHALNEFSNNNAGRTG
jgi:hypothetical protein